MKYLVGDNSINYEVYKKSDKYPADLDLIFTVGCAEEVIYITELQFASSKITEVVTALTEFCSNFDKTCIAFILENKKNAIMRYVLQSAEFRSAEELVDDGDKVLYIHKTAYTWKIFSNLLDEYCAATIDEMIRVPENDGSKPRLELLLARIGKEDAKTLIDFMNKFFALGTESDKNQSPAKMDI